MLSAEYRLPYFPCGFDVESGAYLFVLSLPWYLPSSPIILGAFVACGLVQDLLLYGLPYCECGFMSPSGL